jgi:enoyl-CoA hydratase/carnithine racemase
MSDGTVHYRVDDGVARIVFDRPQARNAMTWAMYDALARACETISADASLRAVLLQGTGGTFVSGTDIAQFTVFRSAEDGIAYEEQIEASIARIEALPVPTVAMIDGWCTGGGLVMACACDIRIASEGARFGVPIARTLGNCLSVANVARLVAEFGTPRVKRMLVLAETIDAAEAQASGFLASVVPPASLESEALAVCGKLKTHAPLTMRAAKEAIRRVRLHDRDGDDLVRLCYGSADFHEGVAAFLAKRKPDWRGR